jgi:rhodanese-related sulfurtransferase
MFAQQTTVCGASGVGLVSLKVSVEKTMGLLRRAARKVLNTVLDKTPHVPAGPPAQRPVPRAEPEPEEEAIDLSNIECGAQELKERLDAGESVTVLDVREPNETRGGIIPGAVVIPLGQLEARWDLVKDANEVVVYCALGARSLKAAAFLRSHGVFNATSMDGGIFAWTEIGGATVPQDE